MHGCAEELRALVDLAAPDEVVLVGDLFTKGPDPAGVWQLVRERGFRSVLGNHDQRVIDAAADPASPDRRARIVAEVLERADPACLPWLRDLPLFVEAAGWTVVHAGLHPSGDLALTDRRMALTLRRWPLEQPSDPYWHAQYTGERRVAFGHDARRGLVRVERDGAPWVLGLDTGCVYGGRLSGYLVEADEVLQVEARRVYKPVGP